MLCGDGLLRSTSEVMVFGFAQNRGERRFKENRSLPSSFGAKHFVRLTWLINLNRREMPQRSDLIITASAAVVFAVYISTLSASIAGGDSGEIVAEGCHLGTAHPPGYPLITTLIYGISKLGEPNAVAYRVNMFCAACTSVAALLIGKTVQMLLPTKSIVGAMCAMGLFAFSPLIWQYAITAEVFPLNTMFAALIVYLVVSFSNAKNNVSIAYIGAFICGLALCNQHTIVLFEAPLILWMLFLLRTHIIAQPAVLAKLSVCFLTGLLPYAYLPIAAILAPKPGSWGQVSTLSGFLHHILRKDYGTFQLFSGEQGKTAEGFAARNTAFLADFVGTQTGLSEHKVWTAYGTVCQALVVIGAVAALWHISWGPVTGAQVKSSATAAAAAKKAISSPTAAKPGKKTTTTASPAPESDSSTMKEAQQPSPAAVPLTLCPRECSFTPLVLLLTLLFYFAVFHTLSNLPLRDRLLYGVHQRFWMQPNIIMFTFLGVGVNTLLGVLRTFLEQGLAPSAAKGSAKSSAGSKTPSKSGGLAANGTKDACDADVASVGKNTSAGAIIGRVVLYVVFWVGAILAILQQYRTWLPVMDMHENTHFRDYATAILSPLPEGSILLINYDQQWTSVRYLQVCEGYRTDVTALQLSMMTYAWFQHKRVLYPNISFPGTYHTYPGSVAQREHGAFTLRQFLDSNIADHHIYLGGKLSYSDPQMSTLYETVPEGMVSRFVPLSAHPAGRATPLATLNTAAVPALDYAALTPAMYVRVAHHSWERVGAAVAVTTLPDPVQYPEETWEWTIGRDYRDRVIDMSAFLLQRALEVVESDALPVIEALYWLESAYAIEGMNTSTAQRLRSLRGEDTLFTDKQLPAGAGSALATPEQKPRITSSLLKNAGLACMHMVRSAKIPSMDLPLPQKDVLQTIRTGLVVWPTGQNWKTWASMRFVHYWGEFLRHPDASSDPQYPSIRSMYETATGAAAKATGSGKSGGGGAGKKSKMK